MAEQDIQVKVEFDTSQATASLKNVSKAAGDTATATTKVGEATQKSQVQIGQFGSALGLAGQAAGQLSPALGSVVSVAGSATGVIQGLTTAGLGPLGIAIGVVSVAVTAGVKLWQDYKTEQERTEESIRRTVLPTLADLKKAFDDAAKAALDEESIQRRVMARTASASDYAATIGRLGAEQTRLRTEQEQLMGKRTADMTAADMRRLSELQGLIANGERNLAQLQENFRRQVPAESEDARLREQNAQRLRAIQAEIEAAGETLNGQPPRTSGGGGRPREAPAASAEAGLYAGGLGTGSEVLSEFEIEALMQGASARTSFLEELAASARQTREEESNLAAQQERENYLAQLDRNLAYLKEREAQEKEAAERLQAINDSVFQALESAFSSSVNAWLDGSMSMGEAALEMVKNVAKSLASEAIIQGLKQTALGLSALAVGSPTAVGHFAAAGKWAAVGVAAGIAGAASGAFGGGGGGGGAPAAATGGPALTAGAREGAGTTVVINWGSSGLVYAADRAQLGRDISGMISEAHGRLGRGM